MLTQYIRAAMHQARCTLLPESGQYYGEIPGLAGVWATSGMLEACRDELEDVLEEWLALRLSRNLPIPALSAT
ncbi:MAG TPA: type II toxin-antitoxin system HicB family antitoxin [Chloroflexota bacterium]|nr:type II toxin-antitoxin system HicB family antitoxin [Chloroflexota bacterium]